MKNEIGNKYGMLTVLKRENNIGKSAAWLCQCDCGKTIITTGTRLRNGQTTSCGCKRLKSLKTGDQSSIKIGDRFGKLVILKDLGLRPQGNSGHNRRWYLCQCDCGKQCEAMGNRLQSGDKKSCGCLKSKGELNIKNLLDNNNIIYKEEVINEELVKQYNRKLRFDFAIYDKNNKLIKYIEFDGRQHSQGMDGVWSNTESLDVIKERDEIKNKFCIEHNIPLARISYLKIKNITLDDLIGDKYNIDRRD